MVCWRIYKTLFYEEIYQLVETNFQHYIDQSGLNEDILNDICSKEKVKQDIEINSIDISISHCKEYAVASVIAVL